MCVCVCLSVCLKVVTHTKNTYAKNTWAKSKEFFLCISQLQVVIMVQCDVLVLILEGRGFYHGR